METETLEQMQARHRREQRELVGRITSKKKNATKKTRKGVNDECADMERRLREAQEGELAALTGSADDAVDESEELRPDATTEITEMLEHAAISEPTQASLQERKLLQEQSQGKEQGQGQGQGQGEGGKKRNRQKERMARRAAEVEAAAVRAEEEARGMTDHRGIEKAYMLGEFKAHSLVEKEIAPDGHCLFSAVADQLQHGGVPLSTKPLLSSSTSDTPGPSPPPPPYRVVRTAAAEWMASHPDDFAPFLEESEGLEAYVGRIRDTAEWGGQLELAALANVYGVDIRVVQDGRTERIGPSTAAATAGEAGGERREIWLAYYRHGYGLGEHYNSLRKTKT